MEQRTQLATCAKVTCLILGRSLGRGIIVQDIGFTVI